GSDRRWTNRNPTFSFAVDPVDDLRFKMRFAVHETTFATTGPVTLTIRINGQQIARNRYTTPGEADFSQRVPPTLVNPRSPVLVELEVDPVWIAPVDHNPLGIVLIRIGFEEIEP